MGDGGQEARREDHPCRPAVQPDQRGGPPARADPGRGGHRVRRRPDQLRAAERQVLPRVRARVHQRARRSSTRTSRTPRISTGCSPARTAEHRVYDAETWRYQGGDVAPASGARGHATARKRQVRQAARGEAHGSGGAAAHPDPDTRRHAAAPALRVPDPQAALRPVHAGDGGEVAGVPEEQFLQVARLITENSGRDRTTAFVYSLGWTQHTVGVQYIRTAAILQALLGNMGRPGGGIMALRGHASIQGSTDIPTLFDLLPGYLPMPFAHGDDDLASYVGPRVREGLLGQHRRLHGQPAEGVVGRRRHGGQRLLLRLPAPADRQPQHLRDGAGPDGRNSARATSCSARTRRSARPTRGCSGWAWPTWTGWWSATW